MWPAQQLPNLGGRSSRSQYQFTLIDADADELTRWVPRVQDRIRRIPGIIDVTTDREPGGLQTNVMIDRTAAARLGIQVQDVDNALNDAFSQRQISTIFTQRNQYRVILETDPQFQRRSRPTSTASSSPAEAPPEPPRAVPKAARRFRCPPWRTSKPPIRRYGSTTRASTRP